MTCYILDMANPAPWRPLGPVRLGPLGRNATIYSGMMRLGRLVMG